MSRTLIIPAAFMLLGTAPLLADDRPVTGDEKTKLMAAVAAEGCEGGTLEFDDDDDRYEVDDARCSDGRRYDLKFDTSFKLIKKDLED